MSIKQRIRHNVIAQFSNPRGIYGRIAGRIMSTRRTNVTRNEWIAEILNPPPGAHILEIGHGPGLAIEHLAQTIGEGHITGLELSPLMSETAERRNRDAARAGIVDFRIGDSANPPQDLRNLDIIFGVNSSMFWPDNQAAISELASRLKPGGQLLLAYMPPPTATEPATTVAAQLVDHFTDAGLANVATQTAPTQPPTIAVTGTRPDQASA
jgi:SAM-dependent methyltransferase